MPRRVLNAGNMVMWVSDTFVYPARESMPENSYRIYAAELIKQFRNAQATLGWFCGSRCVFRY